MTKPRRGWRDRLIDPFLATAAVLLIADHWDQFDVGDFVLLALMALGFALRLPGLRPAGGASRGFAPHARR